MYRNISAHVKVFNVGYFKYIYPYDMMVAGGPQQGLFYNGKLYFIMPMLEMAGEREVHKIGVDGRPLFSSGDVGNYDEEVGQVWYKQGY